jgi:hypothetical protein
VKKRINGDENWGKVQAALKKHCPDGELVSIITVNKPQRRVVCYSKRIEDGNLFRALNLNTGWAIHHEGRGEFRGCKKGFFVLLQDLGQQEHDSDNWFVAIVGTEWDSDESPATFKI